MKITEGKRGSFTERLTEEGIIQKRFYTGWLKNWGTMS